MDEPQRSVVREHEFEEQLRAIIADAEEADEFVAGAENLLSRDPEIGSAIGDGVWFLPMAVVGDSQISLYYTFDAERVMLLAIVAT